MSTTNHRILSDSSKTLSQLGYLVAGLVEFQLQVELCLKPHIFAGNYRSEYPHWACNYIQLFFPTIAKLNLEPQDEDIFHPCKCECEGVRVFILACV